MRKIRLVAVLVVREGQVVQSVCFKHTNVIHYDPVHAIECFNKWAVDEIVILNVSRDADSREKFADMISNTSRKCFVPLTVGGWITDAEYASRLLRSGADKLCLNTAFLTDPYLIKKLARRYGRQCIVASIDIKRSSDGFATVYVDRGRHDTQASPLDWACRAVDMGAGEIFFNSINHDGSRKGYDLISLQKICAGIEAPVIAFGGVFKWHHLVEGVKAGADAVAAANIFHYTEHSARKAKNFMMEAGIPVRSS